MTWTGTWRRAGRLVAAGAAVLLAAESDTRAADGARRPDPAHVKAAVRLMADLQTESRRHAEAIRRAYRNAGPRLAIPTRTALASALDTGSLRILPTDQDAHNLRPRLTGRHPIGEADLAHQHLYVSARPETVGLLLEVAARVRSGPLEITSLARHGDYQRRLARTNANARTAVPTHVMGLAFDVSILYGSLDHVREIRDVLRAMADEGDLFFVAEQRQLVFHVVPAPARRDYYAALAEDPVPARLASDRRLTAPAPDAMPAAFTPVDPPVAIVASVGPVDVSTPPADAAADAASTRTVRSAVLRYAALLGWLVGSGLGTPPGEDLFLAGAGALASDGVLAWWPMLLLAVIGVVTSDLVLFWGGRAAGASIGHRPRLVSHALVRRVDALVHRWGGAAVALARFTPGLRALVFMSAGARGMRPVRFAVIDICAALVWVPLAMTLGAWILVSVLAASATLPFEGWV